MAANAAISDIRLVASQPRPIAATAPTASNNQVALLVCPFGFQQTNLNCETASFQPGKRSLLAEMKKYAAFAKNAARAFITEILTNLKHSA
ncbi:MAG: hypothetical protein P1U83_17190 [Roseovarius sp.]|nr:hypothetical protein [Roseovarius sp.]